MDVTADGTSALFLDFDERRELVIEKIVEHVDFKKFLASQAGSIFQKSWEGKYFFNAHRKLVVLSDATLATTIPVPFDFRRDGVLTRKPIMLGEAGDWFARATAKIFSGCRLEAARRLRTSDVDTVLVNQRVDQIVIDGRALRNPIGRSGKKVSFVIELTFANRELAEALVPFFNAPGEFFFAEAPQARLAALARVRRIPLNLIKARGGARSSLFVLQEAERGCVALFREPFLWDSMAVVQGIADDLNIALAQAEEIYRIYVHGDLSDTARKHFDALMAPFLAQFAHALDKADIRGFTYLDAPRDLPFKLPYHRRRAVIENIPVDTLLKKFGFSGSRHGDHAAPHASLSCAVLRIVF